MASLITTDLSKLPAPTVIETLSYDAILAEILEQFQAKNPDYDALLPSDPAYKVLEQAAFRELIIRQQFNERAQKLMLAYAKGPELDHLGVTYHLTKRLVIDPGDPNANPPIEPTYESDEAYLARILLAPDQYSTAGSTGAYKYHALSASGQVKDASVSTPAPTQVLVTVLSHSGSGIPDPELITTVEAVLTDEDVRPLTDKVNVQAAEIVEFQVTAELEISGGPDLQVVEQTAREAVAAYVSENHYLGRDITLSGLYAALHREGVRNVNLTSPLATVTCEKHQAPYCTGITITTTIGGVA